MYWGPVAKLLPLALLKNLRALHLQFITVDQPPASWSTLTNLTSLHIAFQGLAIPKPVLSMSGLRDFATRGSHDPGMLHRLAESLPGLRRAALQAKLDRLGSQGLPYESQIVRSEYPGLHWVVDWLD